MKARIPGAVSSAYESGWASEEVRLFRRTVRRFIEQEFVPQ